MSKRITLPSPDRSRYHNTRWQRVFYLLSDLASGQQEAADLTDQIFVALGDPL